MDKKCKYTRTQMDKKNQILKLNYEIVKLNHFDLNEIKDSESETFLSPHLC